MGKYKRKIDTIDHERGDCLLLYAENLKILTAINDNDGIAILRSLIKWFLGAAEESAIADIERTATDKRLASTLLYDMIERQKRHVGKYLDDCKRKQENALRAKSRFCPRQTYERQQ